MAHIVPTGFIWPQILANRRATSTFVRHSIGNFADAKIRSCRYGRIRGTYSTSEPADDDLRRKKKPLDWTMSIPEASCLELYTLINTCLTRVFAITAPLVFYESHVSCSTGDVGISGQHMEIRHTLVNPGYYAFTVPLRFSRGISIPTC